MIFWMRDQKNTDVCVQTSWCGFITIRFAAQAEARDLYKPVIRTLSRAALAIRTGPAHIRPRRQAADGPLANRVRRGTEQP